MKTEKQTIDRLIDEFTNHLLTLGRSRSTIRLYRRVWFKVKSYMDSNKIRYLDIPEHVDPSSGKPEI